MRGCKVFETKIAKYLACVVFAAMLLCVQMFSKVDVYGEELHYARDNDIDFYLPDGWDVEEIDPEESSDSGFEAILESSGDGMTFDVYYHKGETEDFIYFDGEDSDAASYYENQGKAVVEGFYDEVYPESQVNIGNYEIYEGDWDTYIKVEVNIAGGPDNGTQLVYLTARNSMTATADSETKPVVDRLLVFGSETGTATAAEINEIAEPIANEYYDFGYDDSLMGYNDSEESSGSYYDDTDYGPTTFQNVMGTLLTFIPFIIIVVVFIIIFRRVRKSRNALLRGTYSADRKKSMRSEKYKTIDRDKKSEKDKHKTDYRKAGSDKNIRNREESYIRSLKTLRSSGLVTKAEMHELLEKYERSKRELERRRRRKK